MYILFLCNSCVAPVFSFEWNKDVPNNDMDILLEQSPSSYYNIL